MNIPENLKYTDTHEWVRTEGDAAVIGISDFAQRELGDIVYVEVPEVGGDVSPDEPLGSVESVKAVSEVRCPLNGTVEGVNEALEDQPELLNSDPYGEGWIAKIALSDPSQLDGLMDSAAYAAYVAEQDS